MSDSCGMAKVRQKAFHPGEKRVNGKSRLFPREELKAYADGTNAAIVAGIPIPLFKKHAPLAADDAVTTQFSATDGAGWLEGVDIDPVDGSLDFRMEVPEDIKKGMDEGTIKFTSPEFRKHYKPNNPAIKFEGPMIRHVAFTPKPRDPVGQGAFETIAMSEDAIQCSDDDFPPEKKKDGDGDGKTGEGDKKPEDKTSEAPLKNPDMPPDANAKTKMAAIVACFSQLGAELPSDFSFESEGAIDTLLAVLKTLAKAKAEADAKPEAKEPETKEEQPNMAFSEEEIAKLPANVQAVIRRNKELEQQAVQFSEEKTVAAKDKTLAAVKAMKIPAGLKSQLVGKLEAVQFSESGEAPTLTIQEAAGMFAAAIPPGLQFDESETTEATPPESGDGFFTDGSPMSDEQAEALARRIHSRDKSKK